MTLPKLLLGLILVGLDWTSVLPAMAAATCEAANADTSVPVSTPPGDFEIHGDGTVTHTKTGLRWKRCAQGQTWDGSTCTGSATAMSWANALIAAKNESFAGHSDWRLPNVKELQSIVEACGHNPSINAVTFPNTTASHFWSSSTYVPSVTGAWGVYFFYGGLSTNSKTDSYYVRLVRTGHLLDTFDLLGPDTHPNSFSFTPQTGVALSSVATSESTIVSGISAAATISIVGGTYAINGGSYTSGAGTVNGGDSVTVRHTSSASYSTTTAATLAIDIQTANFTVTTLAPPPGPPSGVSATPGNISAAVVFTPGANGGPPIDRYRVECSSSNGGASVTSYGGASPITNGPLTPGRDYSCVVTAHNSQGWGTASTPSAGFTVPSVVTRLPDTGIDQCYDGSGMVACSGANTGDAATYKRQDGRYGRDAAATMGELTKVGGGAKGFDYTALDASGNPTSPGSGATPHPCVRDNVTGLVWEVKTDEGALHDQDWTYTWYNSNASTNGGNAGSIGGSTCGGHLATCDTEAYVNAVNAAGWCGFNDWRVASDLELVTLVHAGIGSVAIDNTYFPNTTASEFWSSSTYAPYVAYAWYVHFGVGSLSANGKDGLHYLRLVRGGPF